MASDLNPNIKDISVEELCADKGFQQLWKTLRFSDNEIEITLAAMEIEKILLAIETMVNIQRIMQWITAELRDSLVEEINFLSNISAQVRLSTTTSATPTLYVVHMLRYGDTERHSYVLGAWSTRAAAELAGDVEKTVRAMKYEPLIVCVTVDKPIPAQNMRLHEACVSFS